MQRVCGWCGAVLSPGAQEGPITHGICGPCEDKVLSKLDWGAKTSFLQSLPGAVVLIDDSVRFESANETALAEIRRRLKDIVHRGPGEVFDCVNVRKGGCGFSSACDACALRNTVKSTLETGESHRDVPVTLTVGDNGGRPLSLTITTEKVGANVLLKLGSAAAA